jgi:hypothetical protein
MAHIKKYLGVICLVFLSLNTLSSVCAAQNKIGVIILHAGANEEYTPEGTQLFNFMHDIFEPGFFAGGPIEGNTCYSLIHYANMVEATICGVEEGTPIDVFCSPYTGSYPVHSLISHWPDSGDGSFESDCFNPADPVVYVLTFGHTTVNPATGETIYGPHVEDPQGPGIGIADFLEMKGFSDIDLFSRVPYFRLPYREQVLRWWYGNDVAGYAPEDPEPYNIKDRLQQLLPDHEIVIRHGWDSYAENVDIYDAPHHWSESYETALDELITEEQVDMVIVFYASLVYINLMQYGHIWYDEKGHGISAVPGKTFMECVEDINDGVGPATVEDLQNYLEHKPWDNHWKHPFPLVKQLAEKRDHAVDLRFAPAFGIFEEYESAVLEILRYTVDAYSISDDSALKVIIGHHGINGSFMQAAECDCYPRNMDDDLMQRLINRITSQFAWSGRFDVVAAPIKNAEGATYDPPTDDKPFGRIISVGEIIDASINGIYVNALGEVVDNGNDNFDTIIMLPGHFYTDDIDPLYAFRENTLGNNIFGQSSYDRDKADSNGTAYNADDLDADYATVKVYDGSGWPAQPGCLQDPDGCKSTQPIYKGSPEKPSTVIIAGTILGNAAGVGRQQLTEAAVNAILTAYREPEIKQPAFFWAAPRNRAVTIIWAADNESDVMGYNLYRSDVQGGDYQKITAEPIAIKTNGGRRWSWYWYKDNNLVNGTEYYYLLETLRTPVRTRKHGPVTATPSLFWLLMPWSSSL